MSFCTDSRTENFLNSIGAKWEYVDHIAFTELQERWRRFNYGRETEKDDDLVQEYAHLQEQGSPAPAVIVHHRSDGYEILDGLQRCLAAELRGLGNVSAYVIKTRSDVTCHKIRIASNPRLNGKAPPRDFTLAKAVEILHFQDACTARDIASLLGRSPSDVESEIGVQQHRANLLNIGVQVDKLPRKLFQEAAKHIPNDDYFKASKPIAAFFNKIVEAKIKNGDIPGYVTEFSSIKRIGNKDRHTQYSTKLHEFCRRPEIAMRLNGKKLSTPTTNVISGLRTALTKVSKAARDKHEIEDPVAVDAIREIFNDLKFKLRKLIPDDLRFDGYKDIFS